MGRRVESIKELKIGKKYKQVVGVDENESPIITITLSDGRKIWHEHDCGHTGWVSFNKKYFEHLEDEKLKDLLGD